MEPRDAASGRSYSAARSQAIARAPAIASVWAGLPPGPSDGHDVGAAPDVLFERLVKRREIRAVGEHGEPNVFLPLLKSRGHRMGLVRVLAREPVEPGAYRLVDNVERGEVKPLSEAEQAAVP